MSTDDSCSKVVCTTVDGTIYCVVDNVYKLLAYVAAGIRISGVVSAIELLHGWIGKYFIR